MGQYPFKFVFVASLFFAGCSAENEKPAASGKKKLETPLVAEERKPAMDPNVDAPMEKRVSFDFSNPDKNGTPQGWTRTLDEGAVKAGVLGHEFRIETNKASVRYEHAVNIGNPQCLELAWDWKVAKFPANPDFKRWNDDGRKNLLQSNSLQVVSVFKDGLTVYVIHYLWEPDVEVGYSWRETETVAGIVTLNYMRTVVRSGREGSAEWRSEHRDLIKDFQKFYPKKAVPPLIKVAVRVSSRFADGKDAESDSSVRKVSVKYK